MKKLILTTIILCLWNPLYSRHGVIEEYPCTVGGAHSNDSIMKCLSIGMQNNTSGISTNTDNIATNSTSIASNVTSITTNTTGIATNTTSIGTMSADLNTFKTSTNSQIQSLEREMNSYNSGIASAIAMSQFNLAQEGFSVGMGRGSFKSKNETAFGIGYGGKFSNGSVFQIQASKSGDASGVGISIAF